mmetsp:Transcript_2705/g.2358  ORF Transcript_2705/g.2358 Transcript_2705/m.2358 type:complete len:119 (+) Transcript_2705:940-1296(+)
MKKTTECSISDDLVDFFDSSAPKFKINSKKDTTSCTKEVVLKAYAFKNALFSCEETASAVKDDIIIEIIDIETGEDITDEYSISMTLPEDNEGCPSSCSTQGEDSCLCEDLSVFEVEA